MQDDDDDDDDNDDDDDDENFIKVSSLVAWDKHPY